MMKVASSLEVLNAGIDICTPTACYDEDFGISIANEVAGLQTHDALKEVHDRLMQTRKGCCFNYATALMYRLRDSKNVCVATSPEPPGRKVSIAYSENGHVYICDIVEAVKRGIPMLCCFRIPFKDFEKAVGAVQLHDPIPDASYTQMLFDEGNITPEELAARSLE